MSFLQTSCKLWVRFFQTSCKLCIIATVLVCTCAVQTYKLDLAQYVHEDLIATVNQSLKLIKYSVGRWDAESRLVIATIAEAD